MFMVHVERSGTVLPFFCRGFYSITATQFMFGIWWPPMFTYLLSFVVYFVVFIHGLFHFLVPFNVLFMFIYFHLFSFIFSYSHFFLFSFISSCLFSFLFIFFHVLLFFSLEKTITNLNHLHVDPQLSSAEFEAILHKFLAFSPPFVQKCDAAPHKIGLHHTFARPARTVYREGHTPGRPYCLKRELSRSWVFCQSLDMNRSP